LILCAPICLSAWCDVFRDERWSYPVSSTSGRVRVQLSVFRCVSLLSRLLSSVCTEISARVLRVCLSCVWSRELLLVLGDLGYSCCTSLPVVPSSCRSFPFVFPLMSPCVDLVLSFAGFRCCFAVFVLFVPVFRFSFWCPVTVPFRSGSVVYSRPSVRSVVSYVLSFRPSVCCVRCSIFQFPAALQEGGRFHVGCDRVGQMGIARDLLLYLSICTCSSQDPSGQPFGQLLKFKPFGAELPSNATSRHGTGVNLMIYVVGQRSEINHRPCCG